MSKDEIIAQLHSATEQFHQFCASIDAPAFFQQPAEKWSVAQNVKHLVISAKATRLAFTVPKFIVKLYAGKPNRASRSYEELVAKYKLKLAQGGKANKRFTPQPVSPAGGKDNLLDAFNRSMNKLTHAIDRNWKDDQLDQFIAPHPLLGKITLRELGYFTIHHTYHHLAIVKDRVAAFAAG